MTEYKLMGTENPRTGEVHNWITKDGKSMPIEDVVDDLLWLQAERDECRRLLRKIVTGNWCVTEVQEFLGDIAADAAGGGDEG